ncbi:MAG: hypothetical protein ACE5H7_17535 [Acidiferrobacterales bacterium]
MQQTHLDLGDEPTPAPVLTPKQRQALIKAMADAIIAVLESQPGAKHEPE